MRVFKIAWCFKLHLLVAAKNYNLNPKNAKYKCDTLEVDNWETGISEIEDNCQGKQIMKEPTVEKYLGDRISRDSKNEKNIKTRVRKGNGLVEKIMKML